jgi:hypothetical protein
MSFDSVWTAGNRARGSARSMFSRDRPLRVGLHWRSQSHPEHGSDRSMFFDPMTGRECTRNARRR